MSSIEPPDIHYLAAASGWLGLGNPVEAEAELGRVSPGLQLHPDVLEMRWLIYAEQNKWAEALQVARSLIHAAPERGSGYLHQAYALRRAPGGSLEQAWDALFPAAERFKKEPLFAYNLACYACQLGKLDLARTWFKKALRTGNRDETKRVALMDSDLQPLWEEIKRG